MSNFRGTVIDFLLPIIRTVSETDRIEEYLIVESDSENFSTWILAHSAPKIIDFSDDEVDPLL